MKKGSVKDGLTMLGIMLMASGLIVLLSSSGDLFSAIVPAAAMESETSSVEPDDSSSYDGDYPLTIDDPLGSWPANSLPPFSTETSHQSSSVETSSADQSPSNSSVKASSKKSSKTSSLSSKNPTSSAAQTSQASSSAAVNSSGSSSSAASTVQSSSAGSVASSTPPVSPLSSLTSVSPPGTSSESGLSGALSQNITLTVSGESRTVTYAEALKGMVGKEISASYHNEAIKAQIVACYTFLRYYADRGQIPSVAFASASALNTQWGSTGITRLEGLIQEVGGKLITYNGKPILATYSAMSAGKTNNATDVWSGSKDAFGNPLSYLVTVDSHWDEAGANFLTTPVFTSAEMKAAVQAALGIALTGDPSGWLTINSRNTAGYVLSMSVGGTATTGRILREQVLSTAHVGGSALRSAAFDVAYSAATDTFTFTVLGYGHGVGMSQVGANGMANGGSTWKDIVIHYYTGVTIE